MHLGRVSSRALYCLKDSEAVAYLVAGDPDQQCAAEVGARMNCVTVLSTTLLSIAFFTLLHPERLIGALKCCSVSPLYCLKCLFSWGWNAFVYLHLCICVFVNLCFGICVGSAMHCTASPYIVSKIAKPRPI